MTVLVIAPHPDDESIGVGATIRLHADRGDRVCVVFLTSGEAGLKQLPREQAWQVREGEAKSAAIILGTASSIFLRLPDWYLGDATLQAADLLRPVLEHESPAVIYVPHPRGVAPRSSSRCPDSPLCIGLDRKCVAGSPGLRDLDSLARARPCQGCVTSKMKQKVRAVRCYRSQLEGFRYDRAVLGLGIYRGALTIGCPFAEVFQVIGPH